MFLVENFKDTTYLARGSVKQRYIYQLLKQSGLMDKLSAFTPVVIGTFPLDIQTAASDVDIACYASNLSEFTESLIILFNTLPDFTVKSITVGGEDAVVANFTISSQPFEIFCQTKPVDQQMGYLHMVAEYKLLKQHDEAFKQAVIALKNQGYKTEPAFCKLLNLPGNPYLALLKYA